MGGHSLLQIAQKYGRKAVWESRFRLGGKNSIALETLLWRDTSADLPCCEMVGVCKEPAYIEPTCGYIISRKGVLLEASMETNHGFRPAPWRSGMAEVGNFLKTRVTNAKVIRVPRVISLRHWWEWNYYHFYHDVLGKMSLLADVGIPEDVPLALGPYASQSAFVKQILQQGRLKNRPWIIPADQYILADEVIYCRTSQSNADRFKYLLDAMEAPVRPVGSRRVFLTRRKVHQGNSSRNLINAEEACKAATELGFEVVDTQGMSVDAQIQLFSETRHLVAVHGAGMVNMIYRHDSPLSVLELRSDTYTNDCFRQIAEEMGYHWDLLSGTSDGRSPQQADFHLSIPDLQTAMEQMLDQEANDEQASL